MRKPKPKPWTPFVRTEANTKPQWATDWLNKHPEDQRDEFWINSRYMVSIKRTKSKSEDWPDLIHLSIRTLDRTAQHDWRDFQRIKTELIGPEQEAIELYPAESRLVDASNQYHLWCLDGLKWPFGFNQRVVTNVGLPGTVQRPHDDPPADCLMTHDEVLAAVTEKK